MLKKILVIIIISNTFLLAAEKSSVSGEDLQRLEAEISSIKKRMQNEKLLFEKYTNETATIISQKRAEIKLLSNEIATVEKESAEERFTLMQKKNAKETVLSKLARYTRLIASIAEKAKEKIGSGINFEREKREGRLSAMLLDMKTANNAAEYINRLSDFYSSEEALCYDNSAINTVVKHEESDKEAKVIRIGKIFLTAQIASSVYPSIYTNGEYIFSEKAFSFGSGNSVLEAGAIINATKPPNILFLPINGARIEAKYEN